MNGRLLLLLMALSPLAALAQGEGEAQPDVAAEPQPEAKKEEAPAAVAKQKGGAVVEPPQGFAKLPAVKLDPDLDRQLLIPFARQYFAAITLGETRFLADLSALPFQLEDQKLSTEDQFLQAWQKNFRQKNTGALTLYGIEMYTAAEMEKKYGKPPARLANFPWKRPGSYVVVANLSGKAAVAVFLKTHDGFAAVGYHD